MGFLDIPGLNNVQKSGGKGWSPANGVPFCARAYIGGWAKKVNFDPGWSKVRSGRQSLGVASPYAAHEVRVHTTLFFCF